MGISATQDVATHYCFGECAYGPNRTKAIWYRHSYPLPEINGNRMKNKLIKGVFDNILDNVREGINVKIIIAVHGRNFLLN
ncbi:MAG: hypothetical protein ACLFQV_00400 [Vulcanimicrobiota bacterium]